MHPRHAAISAYTALLGRCLARRFELCNGASAVSRHRCIDVALAQLSDVRCPCQYVQDPAPGRSRSSLAFCPVWRSFRLRSLLIAAISPSNRHRREALRSAPTTPSKPLRRVSSTSRSRVSFRVRTFPARGLDERSLNETAQLSHGCGYAGATRRTPRRLASQVLPAVPSGPCTFGSFLVSRGRALS